MRVQIFADVTDPWSYIGVTRFERAAATFTIIAGEQVEVSLRSFQLDPDEPSEGRPLMAALAERLGGLDRAEFLNVQVEAAAKITGVDLNFLEAVQANSFDAHRLLTWAREFGAGAQRDLAHQLWRAHFLEGADVADHLVLATRAALVGLELETAEALLTSTEYGDEVTLQNEAARSIGVTQLPTVIVEGTWTLAGVQSQDDYVQALNQIYHDWKAEQA